MATIAVTTIARTGPVLLALVAASSGGDKLPNDGMTVLAVKNGSGSAVTVSAAIIQQVDGVTPAPKSIVVPAGQTAFFGPFPTDDYNDTSGSVAITYSSATSVTVQGLQMITPAEG